MRPKSDAALVGRKVVLRGDIRKAVLDVVLRFRQKAFKGSRRRPDEFVRVLRAGHAQHTDLEVELLQNADRPLGRLLAGLVAVVGNDDLVHIAGDEPCLLRRQRGAERGDRTVKARLVQRDDIDIAPLIG